MERRGDDLRRFWAVGRRVHVDGCSEPCSTSGPWVGYLMASVQVFPDRAGPVLVRMAGEFDMANADDLRAELLALDGDRAIVLDLAETSYIDSSVLGVLAEMVRRGMHLKV